MYVYCITFVQCNQAGSNLYTRQASKNCYMCAITLAQYNQALYKLLYVFSYTHQASENCYMHIISP